MENGLMKKLGKSFVRGAQIVAASSVIYLCGGCATKPDPMITLHYKDGKLVGQTCGGVYREQRDIDPNEKLREQGIPVLRPGDPGYTGINNSDQDKKDDDDYLINAKIGVVRVKVRNPL